MEFSVFFGKLSIEHISTYNNEQLLIEYKKCCVTENDFIQLYELKNILEVINLFSKLYNAYINCNKESQDPLFNEIEEISNLLEEKNISCYSYSYYIYVFLMYIYDYETNLNNSDRKLGNTEMPEQMVWQNPNHFDYAKLGETTFGVNEKNTSGFTTAFPKFSNFHFKDGKLVSYKGLKPYVIIPDTTLIIGAKAFKGNKKIKMIIIPDSVQVIEEGAFEGCKGLNLVHLGKNINKIPNNCFKNCENLKYIIGDGIEEVGDCAFELCVQLKDINLDSLLYVGTKSFYGCVSLNNFDFVSNLMYIGDYAFASCEIDSLFINECEYLGSFSFINCSKLVDLIINNDIDDIGETPFYACTNINAIDIRDAVSFNILNLFATNNLEYDKMGYNLTNVIIFETTPYICANLNTLKTVTINGYSDKIFNNAFQNCINLEEIIFKNKNINFIDDYAFENCSALTTLNINFNGNKIGKSSFYGCSKINNFDFLWNVDYFDDKCLAYTNLSTFDFYNRKFKYIGAFAFANSYYSEDLNIQLNGTKISAGAFHGFNEINCLEIKNCSLSSELLFAIFERTKKEFLENVIIKSLITDYEATPYLFAGFNSTFIECNLKDSIIPEGTFNDCPSLVSVRLNGFVNIFGPSCFECCELLSHIDVEVDDEVIVQENAFINCKNYTYPYFYKTKIIEEYAFYGTNINELILGNNIEYIGNCAFGGCQLNPSIRLPFVGNEKNSDQPLGVIFAYDRIDNAEVQVIGDQKYYISNEVKHIIVTSEAISAKAFKNCYFLETIELPNVAYLPNNVFGNCSSLKELVLGSQLEDFNGLSLVGASEDVSIVIYDNDKFKTVNNSVFSSDQKILYYSNHEKSFNNVLVYKTYSMPNIKKELTLSDVDLVEQYAFNIENVHDIYLNNVDRIKINAFNNCNDLRNLSIISSYYKEYSKIIHSNVPQLHIRQVVFENISLKSIIDLFNGVNNLTIDELKLINCVLEKNTFSNIIVNNLIVSNCEGSSLLNNNINNVVVESSLEFAQMFKGFNEFETIKISKSLIRNKDLEGIKCSTLTLSKVDKIKCDAFDDVTINTLNIYDVQNIEKGTFFNCDINVIDIYNSIYVSERNCIYKDDTLVYYKPIIKNANNNYDKLNILVDLGNIPISITKVCERSINLKNIKSVSIPTGLEFEEHAIYNTSNIESIICESINLKKICNLFDDCSNVKYVHFKGSAIPNKFLSNLPSIEIIYLDNVIENIGDFAFYNDTNLKKIVNIENAKHYGDFAFANCSSLEKICLNSVSKSIGFNIVDGCMQLKSIEMPLLDYYVDQENVISEILGEITSETVININNGNIPDNMFKDCANPIKIFNKPEYIGKNAFSSTENILIDLSKAKFIGDNAFYNCKGIKQVSLNSNIETIAETAFDETNLELITIQNNPIYRVEQNCLFFKDDLIYYPSNNNSTDIKFNHSVNRIRKKAFNNCVNLNSIIFDSVNVIEELSFNNCKNLSRVDLGKNEIVVDGKIFNNCDNLRVLAIYKIKQGKNNCLIDYFSSISSVNFPQIMELKIYNSVLDEEELNCYNEITDVLLSDDTEIIPNGYFKNCSKLVRITIPNNCLLIGDDAFNGCFKLQDVDLSNLHINTIGDRAFANTSIKEITINESVTSLGQYVLKYTPIEKININAKLKDFSCEKYGIGKTVTSITFASVSFDDNAFKDQTNLRSIEVAKYLGDSIPSNCFSNCSNLSNINIPATYNVIKSNAFENCNLLEKFYISENVKVDKNAFKGCNGITEFIYECIDKNFSLEYLGFDNENSSLKSVIIKNSTLSNNSFTGFKNITKVEIHNEQLIIPSNCFKNCINVKDVTINFVKTIEESAFEGCKNLLEFNLSNCDTIKDFAFKDCISLNRIVIPNSIKHLGKAFTGCFNIQEIDFLANISEFIMSDYGFENDGKIEKVTLDNIALGESAFEEYHTIKEIIVNNAQFKIPTRCFKNCSNLKTVKIFEFNIVEESAFEGCKKLVEFDLLKCEIIKNFAFKDCQTLEKVIIPTSIKQLGKAFIGCLNIKEIDFLANVSDFRMFNYGFEISGKVEKVNFNEINLGKLAFEDFKSLQKVTFNYPIVNIPECCFRGCINLSFDSEFLANIETIEENAFTKSNVSGKINLSKLRKLSKCAFADCDKIVSVILGDDLKEIPEGAFIGCTKLDYVSLPKNLEIIGGRAFAMTKIVNIEIPPSIKYMGPAIFEGNTKKITVNLDKNVDTSKWSNDWDEGLVKNGNAIMKLFKFKPKVILKKRNRKK